MLPSIFALFIAPECELAHQESECLLYKISKLEACVHACILQQESQKVVAI